MALEYGDTRPTPMPTLRTLRFVSLLLAVLVASGCARTVDESNIVRNEAGDPLVSTFSIVAVDTTTGEMGVAVQSKFPNVRFMVPTVVAGVGAMSARGVASAAVIRVAGCGCGCPMARKSSS